MWEKGVSRIMLQDSSNSTRLQAMPRQVRIQFPGAVYHVMARGDRREAIYRDEQDRRMFLDVFEEACGRTGWRCHAFVLMSNHYHLVLETPEPNLVAGMGWLQNTYTRRHNVRHKLWGHVFGGRYKAVLVEPDGGDYFGTLLDYVHLNPVRAGLVRVEEGLEGFRWSSLRYYLAAAEKRKEWQQARTGLACRGCEDDVAGRRSYLEYLEGRARNEGEQAGHGSPGEQTLQSALRRGWYFGGEAFRAKMLAFAESTLRLRSRKADFAAAPEVREHQEADAEALVQKGLQAVSLAEGDLACLARGDERKAMIALGIRKTTTVPLGWIARRLDMGTRSTVSREVNALARRMKTDKNLTDRYAQLIAAAT